MTVILSKVTVTLEVMVTPNDMAICSSLQSDRHFWKNENWKMMSKWCETAKKAKKSKKKFQNFCFWHHIRVTVTSNDMAICSSLQSDGHLWKSDCHFFKVTSRWPKPIWPFQHLAIIMVGYVSLPPKVFFCLSAIKAQIWCNLRSEW